MTDGTTPTPTPAPTQQSALSTLIQTIVKDATADEKAALKPVLAALAAGMLTNPDAIGWQLLLGQFASGLLAAQVQVKGQLIPQIGQLLQTLVASW